MIDISVQILQRRLDKAYIKAPKVISREVGKAFVIIGADFERTMLKENLRKGGDPRSKSSSPGLHRRTGRLASTYGHTVTGKTNLNRLTLRSGWFDPFGARIANVHERGATITGKPWLTVPLRDAMTPAGVVKFPRARDFPNTFIKKNKSGKLFIMQQRGAKVVALFVLRRTVTIPPRLRFVQTWESRDKRTFRIKTINAAIGRALDKTRRAAR